MPRPDQQRHREVGAELVLRALRRRSRSSRARGRRGAWPGPAAAWSAPSPQQGRSRPSSRRDGRRRSGHDSPRRRCRRRGRRTEIAISCCARRSARCGSAIRRPLKSHTIDRARRNLDQAVQPEADQGDRTGRKSRADGDRELDHVPGVAAPGQQAGPPHQRRSSLTARSHEGRCERRLCHDRPRCSAQARRRAAPQPVSVSSYMTILPSRRKLTRPARRSDAQMV